MQKVTFNNGKLAVYADDVNILNDDKENTIIVGEFTIQADDVAKLISLLYGKCFETGTVYNMSKCVDENAACIVSERHVYEEINKSLEKSVEDGKRLLRETNTKLSDYTEKYNKLSNKVNYFNLIPWYKRIFKKIEI